MTQIFRKYVEIMKNVLYNGERKEGRRNAVAMPNPYSPNVRREHRRRSRFRIWNRFVLAVGYLALAYGLVRGVIYLLVLAKDWL